MPSINLVVVSIFVYVLILFGVAYIGESSRKKNHKIHDNALIYSLSLAVYCTSWTFYGSVGTAANNGLLFLAVYLGPMISTIAWSSVLTKLIRIKNKFRITSIVDFVSARYDKSEGLGMVASFLLIFGMIPYIALQLKAIIKTIHLISNTPQNTFANGDHIGLYVVLMVSLCTIFFGIRKLSATERHPGMVLVLVFESLVKLAAFLTIGIFVTYFMNHGIDDLLSKLPTINSANFTFMGSDGNTDSITWITYLILSASAVLFLPRQFHIAVIENTNENHVQTAKWLFPLYLFLINIFVLPIAIGGVLAGLDIVNADYFVLLLSQIGNNKIFSLFIFLGGFSAATGMIMLETMTISTIITNNVLLPISSRFKNLSWMTKHLLKLRWLAAVSFILGSYFYMEVVGEKNALLAMGMISFVASLQFVPIILGSLFWKDGSKTGAYAGLSLGAILWFYTLIIPSFIKSGWLSENILKEGAFGVALLIPESQMGLYGLHPLSHAVFWTMLLNVGAYVTVSILYPPSESEQQIAEDFVNPKPSELLDEVYLDESHDIILLEEKVNVFYRVLVNYFSENKSNMIIQQSLNQLKINLKTHISILKLAELYDELEKIMAGFIGTAAAHHALQKAGVFSTGEREDISKIYGNLLASMKINPNELKKQIFLNQEKEKIMLQETRQLEAIIQKKTLELEEQKNVNFHISKMSALGEMAGGIAHELNNPLTIISSSNQVIRKLVEKGTIDKDLFLKYCNYIDKTITRISKIIIGLKTVSRDATNEDFLPTTIGNIIDDVVSLCGEKYRAAGNELRFNLNDPIFQTEISCRRVQISQVILNLLSNSYDAIEFLPERWIQIDCAIKDERLVLRFIDSGSGIPKDIQEKIFLPFYTTKEVGKGTGLGLSISNSIINNHNGNFYIDNDCLNTCFVMILPISKPLDIDTDNSEYLAS
jgi:Na+/proline symporter/signal transduction histidine kinase